eukprot:TRINITY_DN140_c0_g1_i1.p1 TRINITY_DN140_c0_g1~~TRINITY_DN140_c0_g1_i1.p1  ORF type:complete len:982 (-),score=189.46 TRINITY_DN140_c0_g1_i1:73-3018(-)
MTTVWEDIGDFFVNLPSYYTNIENSGTPTFVAIMLAIAMALVAAIIVNLFEGLSSFQRFHWLSPQKVAFKFSTVWYGAPLLAMISGIVSTVSTGLFFYEVDFISATWAANNTVEKSELIVIFETSWLVYLEFSISIVLFFDYCMRMYIAPSRGNYILNVSSIIEILSITPGLVGPIFGFYYYGFQITHSLRIYGSLSFLRRLELPLSGFMMMIMEVVTLIVQISTVFLIMSGIIFVHENIPVFEDGGSVVSFIESFYFVVITLTTVGYGDISPNGATGRAIVMIGIFSGLILIPAAASQISKRFKKIYHDDILPVTAYNEHAILFCRDSVCMDFVTEYLQTKPKWQPKLLIVLPHDIETFKEQPEFEKMRVMLRTDCTDGDIMNDSDAKRLSPDKAKVCFIMANNFEADHTQMDATNILAAQSILLHNRRLPVYIQILDNVNRKLLRNKNVHFMCTHQITAGILAQNTNVNGLTTLLSNLVTTPSETAADYRSPYLPKYYRGTLFNSIHTSVSLGLYVGRKFKKVVLDLIDSHYIALLGIRRHIGKEVNTIIFPVDDFLIEEGDIGIVIAGHLYRPNLGEDSQGILNKLMGDDEYDMSELSSITVESSVREYSDTQSVEVSSQLSSITGESGSLIVDPDDYRLNNSGSYSVTEEDFSSSSVSSDEFTIEVEEEIQDHIVICGNVPFYTIFQYIKYLQVYFEDIPRIVIIRSEEYLPDAHQKNKLNRFENVSVIIGHADEIYDLKKAKIQRAKICIIFAHYREGIVPTSQDSYALMIYRLISAYDCFPIIELYIPDNMQFLSESPHYQFNPLFASGHIFPRSILDNILCNAYFNRGLIQFFETITTQNVFSKFHLQDILSDSWTDLEEIKHKRRGEKRYVPFINVVRHLVKEKKILVLAVLRRTKFYADGENRRSRRSKERRKKRGTTSSEEEEGPTTESEDYYVLSWPNENFKVQLDDYVIVLHTSDKKKIRKLRRTNMGE